MTSSPSTLPQSSKHLFDVNTVEARSWRALMRWKNRIAPSWPICAGPGLQTSAIVAPCYLVERFLCPSLWRRFNACVRAAVRSAVAASSFFMVTAQRSGVWPMWLHRFGSAPAASRNPPVWRGHVPRLCVERCLALKTPYDDGTSHVVLSPMEFIGRLAALVPKPRVNLTRFHRAFSCGAWFHRNL